MKYATPIAFKAALEDLLRNMHSWRRVERSPVLYALHVAMDRAESGAGERR